MTADDACEVIITAPDRDWLAGTPWHKHVRARLEAIVEAVA